MGQLGTIAVSCWVVLEPTSRPGCADVSWKQNFPEVGEESKSCLLPERQTWGPGPHPLVALFAVPTGWGLDTYPPVSALLPLSGPQFPCVWGVGLCAYDRHNAHHSTGDGGNLWKVLKPIPSRSSGDWYLPALQRGILRLEVVWPLDLSTRAWPRSIPQLHCAGTWSNCLSMLCA